MTHQTTDRDAHRATPPASLRRRYALATAVLLLGPFAALTTMVVLTAPGVFFLDADVASALHGFTLERPYLGTALRVVSLVTLPNIFRVIALISAWLLWRRGHRRSALWLLVTMTIGGVLGIVLKQVFTRSRPEWPEAIYVASGYSYPSGHALNSMLAAGCAIVLLDRVLTGRRRRLLRVGAAGMVLLVGFDRVALGVHYLTDVLAGWTLALAVLFATLTAFGPLQPLTSTGPPASADLPDPGAPNPDLARPIPDAPRSGALTPRPSAPSPRLPADQQTRGSEPSRSPPPPPGRATGGPTRQPRPRVD